MRILREALLATALPLLGFGLLQVNAQIGAPDQKPTAARTSAPAGTHRVLFALTSGEQADWVLTLGNIRNLIADLKPDTVEIELVAYGPGTAMVRRDSAVAGGIAALQSPHVRFVACENSMRVQGLTKADLAPEVGTVPAGIGEVVRREESGWSYIKAGR